MYPRVWVLNDRISSDCEHSMAGEAVSLLGLQIVRSYTCDGSDPVRPFLSWGQLPNIRILHIPYYFL